MQKKGGKYSGRFITEKSPAGDRAGLRRTLPERDVGRQRRPAAERERRRDDRIRRRERKYAGERESENLPERDAPDDGEWPPPREKPATSLTGEEICTAERFQRERVRERERDGGNEISFLPRF
jgi:hypothetical protein